MPLKSPLCNRHIATLNSFFKNCVLLYLLNLSFLLLPYAHHILSYSLPLSPSYSFLSLSLSFTPSHLLPSSLFLTVLHLHPFTAKSSYSSNFLLPSSSSFHCLIPPFCPRSSVLTHIPNVNVPGIL